MINLICPKLPMLDKAETKAYYTERLGFQDISAADYPHYIILSREGLELHLFWHPKLDPAENYGQVYLRCQDIEALYAELQSKGTQIHPNGALTTQPWGMKEFSLLDLNGNLLTFGEAV